MNNLSWTIYLVGVLESFGVALGLICFGTALAFVGRLFY